MKKLFKYSQQIIIAFILITTSAGIILAEGGPGFTENIISGFLRAGWHYDTGPQGHYDHRFYYGYGFSGLNQEWGYGYGYSDKDIDHHAPDWSISEYGFEGTEGPVTIDSATTTKTTATITYSTNYLARIISGYGTGLPLTQSNVLYVHTDADFNSGERVWEIEGLTCNTTYYYTLRAKDAADNAWPIEDSFTTDQCHDTTITGMVPGSSLSNESQSSQSQNHNPRGLRLPPIILKLGSVGQDVQDLQILLNFFGTFLSSDGAGSPGNETQTFGQRTFNALKKFQKTFGLEKVDGIYGPETQGVMKSFLE